MAKSGTIHDFELERIDGAAKPLADFAALRSAIDAALAE